MARSLSTSSSSWTSSSRCSVRTSWTAAIARIRLTESPSAFCGSTFAGSRLEPQQRGHGLQVVLDPVVDLLSEDPTKRHAAVLERHGGLARDRLEQLAIVVRERRVAIDHELADRPAAPAQRQSDGLRAGASLGPRDPPVLEHDGGAGRVHRLDRRLHDRLERLLEVERLRHRLGDPGQRLELVHAALRLRVELGVLDRLRDLARNRHQQVDLGLRERPRLDACGR